MPRERVGGRYCRDTSPSVRSVFTDIVRIGYLWGCDFSRFLSCVHDQTTHMWLRGSDLATASPACIHKSSAETCSVFACCSTTSRHARLHTIRMHTHKSAHTRENTHTYMKTCQFEKFCPTSMVIREHCFGFSSNSSCVLHLVQWIPTSTATL